MVSTLLISDHHAASCTLLYMENIVADLPTLVGSVKLTLAA
jgi:hypothetical protein